MKDDEELTDEQRVLMLRKGGIFTSACPGAGKTRAMVARVVKIATDLPLRAGLAVLSFTNSAVEDFTEKCRKRSLGSFLKFPNFVGTFDGFVSRFLIRPGGIEGVSCCPIIVDSWSVFDNHEVHLRNVKGEGISLDKFDPQHNRIDAESIRHNGTRHYVLQYQKELEKEASRRRQNFRRNGYLSAADARVEVLRKMQNKHWAAGIGKALAARFVEVIVDEAQDCNALDIQILAWLRAHGMPVTIVCDLDQAIYGFRYGDPTKLKEFRDQYEEDRRLLLTGNFRSTRTICALASTLRDRPIPDVALGTDANAPYPVYLLEYYGRKVPASVGEHFRRILTDSGIALNDAIILSHARNNALRACGLTRSPGVLGSSRVETMAAAVAEFWAAPSASRAREDALRSAEKVILKLMGKIDDNEHLNRAVERQGIDRRWLRRTALGFILRLPSTCSDTTDDRARWVATLQDEVRRLDLDYAASVTPKSFFRPPAKTGWSEQLHRGVAPDLRCSTIHEAKGREYEAVCIVIPPDAAGRDDTSRLLAAWKNRTNDECKRVVYVGVTRAKKLIALAIPNMFCKCVISILGAVPINQVVIQDPHTLRATPVATKKLDDCQGLLPF